MSIAFDLRTVAEQRNGSAFSEEEYRLAIPEARRKLERINYLLRHPLATGKDSGIIVGLQRQKVHSRKAVAQIDRVRSEYQPVAIGMVPGQP